MRSLLGRIKSIEEYLGISYISEDWLRHVDEDHSVIERIMKKLEKIEERLTELEKKK